MSAQAPQRPRDDLRVEIGQLYFKSGWSITEHESDDRVLLWHASSALCAWMPRADLARAIFGEE